MKKIKSKFDAKDRVICLTVRNRHEFYYQPVGSKDRVLLFTTDNFSGSVFAYFRDHGRSMSGGGFSLTIKELYEFKCFHNVKLMHVMQRIPVMIDYVIRECLEPKMEDYRATYERASHQTDLEDRELVA